VKDSSPSTTTFIDILGSDGTPGIGPLGTAGAVDDARQVILNTAYAAHPERFAGHPMPPRIPEQPWINQPNQNCRTPDHRAVSLDLAGTADRHSDNIVALSSTQKPGCPAAMHRC
jgi:hypothetical protein